jgi:hypothetical protein
MILGVWWEGLWTFSFELSQLHGHGSWLVCELALTYVLSKNHTCTLGSEGVGGGGGVLMRVLIHIYLGPESHFGLE